jgi:hypothetical protein
MPAGYAGSRLDALVPVELAGLAAPKLGAAGARPVLTAAGRAFPMLRLHREERDNESLWQRMPAIHWFYPAARAKPGGEVLLDACVGPEAASPLVVRQRYGAGQVLFVGTDETWRWRQLPGGEYHRRLWSQIVTQTGLGHVMGGERRVNLDGDPREAPLGVEVAVLARVRGTDNEPLVADRMLALAEHESGRVERVPLPAQTGQKGVYSAGWTPREMGRYRLCLETLESEGECPISVVAPRIEFEDPALREDLLKRLAAATGGEYLPLDRFADLPRRLADLKPLVRIQRQERSLWNAPGLLILLTLAFGLEWWLRKRWDLM